MSARPLAHLGVASVVASLALYAWLHLTPPSSELDWQTRTISQYALLENGWAFDAATLLLAAGSALILAALIRSGVTGPRSGASVAMILWIAGLAGVVAFEKHNWAAGPSMSGDVHRAASVVAFLALPAAALLLGGPWLRRRPDRTAAALVVLGGVVSLLCFAPILYALISEPWTGIRWWRAIPLGGVERLLGAVEVATVLAMAWWANRRSSAAPADEASRVEALPSRTR